MTEIYLLELLSIVEAQTALQNKETTVQSYWKISNQNTKKSRGIAFALFNSTGEIGMNNFGYLNSSLSLFDFYFVMNLRKKIAYVRLLNPPPPIRAFAILARPHLPPPSVRTLWMTPRRKSALTQKPSVQIPKAFISIE